MATGNNLFISLSPIIQKLIITSGATASAQSSLESLSSRLCAAAKDLYLCRDFVSLSQVVNVLCTLPLEDAKSTGLYYRAMCERKAGRKEPAARLLEVVSNNPRFRARALQALALIYRHDGDIREAARLYGRAIENASADIPTLINATINLSELSSFEGDHRRSLDQLRAIRPAVEMVSRVHPYYVGLYCNEVAFELSHIGKLAEARRFAAYALASPYARAWPEWRETAYEIEQQAEAKPVLNRNARSTV